MVTTRRLRPSLFVFGLAFVFAGGCTGQDTGAPKADAPSGARTSKDGPQPGLEADEPALPDGAALLAEHVEAAGGADAIAKFESFHANGTVDTGEQRLRGTTELWWKKDGKFYLEQVIEGVGKSRAGYDGEVVWAEDPITGLRRLEGKEAASYIQSSMMFPAFQWREHFESATTTGKKTLTDGSEVWTVELRPAEGPTTTFALDIETKLIRVVQTTQVTMMGDVPFEAHAQDYREIQGYKFAMKKHSSIIGLLELDEEITSFEVNVDIADEMFAFPNAREVVAADPSAQPPIEAATVVELDAAGGQ